MEVTSREVTSQPLLSVAELSCRFGGVLAVDSLSFEIHANSATGIIGPNGAGKTTVFNVITGLAPRTEGTICFNGRVIESLRPFEIARLGIGRTFQTVRVFGDLPVRDNLLVADFLSATAGEGSFDDRVTQVLSRVGMEGLEDDLAGELSYGQQKLIELAMVLINRPQLILLDEPVAGVNPMLIRQIGEVLQNLLDHGLTLLIVEHNIPFVMELCDTVLVMASGQKLLHGTEEKIRNDPKVLEAFLGS